MGDASEPKPLVVVAGYGLPGRAIVQKLIAQRVPYCVIELNPKTVTRCSMIGAHIINGDCSKPEVLREAGIETAKLFLIAVPDDVAVLETTKQARKMNPTIHIIARCRYVSTGMETHVAGANEVIVAEQLVADAFAKVALPPNPEFGH